MSDGLWAFVCPRILGFDIIMLDDRLHKVRRLFDGFWELPQGFPGPTFNVLGSWTVPVVQQSGRFPGFLLFFSLCVALMEGKVRRKKNCTDTSFCGASKWSHKNFSFIRCIYTYIYISIDD